MTPLDRYTLLMTAARDHARQSEWEIARDQCLAAASVKPHTWDDVWPLRRAFANRCRLIAESERYRRKMGGRYAREAT
jgi:hypothetical protein